MRLRELLLGKPIPDSEAAEEQLGPVAAVPVLGLDALASAAYGPEAALTILIPLGAAGVGLVAPITAVIVALLLPLLFSHTATALKMMLLFRGGPQIVVVNAPWYLRLGHRLRRELPLLAGDALGAHRVLRDPPAARRRVPYLARHDHARPPVPELDERDLAGEAARPAARRVELRRGRRDRPQLGIAGEDGEAAGAQRPHRLAEDGVEPGGIELRPRPARRAGDGRARAKAAGARSGRARAEGQGRRDHRASKGHALDHRASDIARNFSAAPTCRAADHPGRAIGARSARGGRRRPARSRVRSP